MGWGEEDYPSLSGRASRRCSGSSGAPTTKFARETRPPARLFQSLVDKTLGPRPSRPRPSLPLSARAGPDSNSQEPFHWDSIRSDILHTLCCKIQSFEGGLALGINNPRRRMSSPLPQYLWNISCHQPWTPEIDSQSENHIFDNPACFITDAENIALLRSRSGEALVF